MKSIHRSPEVADPLILSRAVRENYRNVSIAIVNDHEIRMSVMTEQFAWHLHPDSDETFVGVDGELVIELNDGEIILKPGQLATIPAGTLHRTRPAGERSVNLTFERRGASTVLK
jgi:mannose-6-phosphate isomerase-like protein (cupin superfamily)